ncbi:MAG TPA: putative metal-binding motif-containing protein, partial [Polyangiales bacterium]|nr:putative metal-binding motif-containing protein [Polyangiales bacterium]
MGEVRTRQVFARAPTLSDTLAALLLACVLLSAGTAVARRDGIAAEGCSGCHQRGQAPGVRVLAAPANPAPGQMVAITVEIDAVNGSVGGFYLKLDGAGSLQAPAGSGIRSFSPAQLGHSAPKAASAGVVRFTMNYVAPATPGGAIFRAWAVSGNGDNRSDGDGGAEAELLLAYGCTGELYALDPDGDGFGAAEFGQKRDCSLPAGYSQRVGDCAEYDPLIHPEAPELCNEKDDDCDGEPDEGLPLGPQYPDGDADGHGDATSA